MYKQNSILTRRDWLIKNMCVVFKNIKRIYLMASTFIIVNYNKISDNDKDVKFRNESEVKSSLTLSLFKLNI